MKKIFLCALAVTLLFSCSKDLDIAPPNSITDEQIRKLLESGDEKKIQAVLGGMANNMPKLINFGALSSESRYGSNQGFDVMRNLEGNDIVLGNRLLNIFGSDEYNLLDFISDASDKNTPYWNYAWNMVNTANKMLNYLNPTTVGTNKKLQEYKGRGLILRAYAYNYLMENYQNAYLQGGRANWACHSMILILQFRKARPDPQRTKRMLSLKMTSTRLFDYLKKQELVLQQIPLTLILV
ncbi:RagB/SusD family nutrient uptake outer membrane protein [Sphingobacterium sp. E70]|uniref:RagB/SusD family nutrient uptake outer membrane protein n=1 Tax=Sphingobacterium sp. E70 TaxID=2853439 RepID=UPI00211BF54C|nr:RagB/SusD family nutrient uptake outer membrane protein [Sphingobacterium sp. E70]ULT22290.1 RagB/SusD family nutrient uptake outer membrane protein [Sphingobacterium sp. E70]